MPAPLHLAVRLTVAEVSAADVGIRGGVDALFQTESRIRAVRLARFIVSDFKSAGELTGAPFRRGIAGELPADDARVAARSALVGGEAGVDGRHPVVRYVKIQERLVPENRVFDQKINTFGILVGRVEVLVAADLSERRARRVVIAAARGREGLHVMLENRVLVERLRAARTLTGVVSRGIKQRRLFGYVPFDVVGVRVDRYFAFLDFIAAFGAVENFSPRSYAGGGGQYVVFVFGNVLVYGKVGFGGGGRLFGRLFGSGRRRGGLGARRRRGLLFPAGRKREGAQNEAQDDRKRYDKLFHRIPPTLYVRDGCFTSPLDFHYTMNSCFWQENTKYFGKIGITNKNERIICAKSPKPKRGVFL